MGQCQVKTGGSVNDTTPGEQLGEGEQGGVPQEEEYKGDDENVDAEEQEEEEGQEGNGQ